MKLYKFLVLIALIISINNSVYACDTGTHEVCTYPHCFSILLITTIPNLTGDLECKLSNVFAEKCDNLASGKYGQHYETQACHSLEDYDIYIDLATESVSAEVTVRCTICTNGVRKDGLQDTETDELPYLNQ